MSGFAFLSRRPVPRVIPKLAERIASHIHCVEQGGPEDIAVAIVDVHTDAASHLTIWTSRDATARVDFA
jgi:hypothetical protein